MYNLSTEYFNQNYFFFYFFFCENRTQRRRPEPSSNTLHAIFFSFSSALPGTQAVVMGKILAVLVRQFVSGEMNFETTGYIFPIGFAISILFSFIFFISYWMFRCEESTLKFNALFIVPMNQV